MNSAGDSGPSSGLVQRLRADRAAAARVDDRLVREPQRIRRDRAAQRLLDREAALQPQVQLRGEEREVVATALLRVVHRGIGVAHQRGRVVAVARRDADADRHAEPVLVVRDLERLRDRVDHLARERGQRVGIVAVLDEDHELVAADARERMAAAAAYDEPRRDAAQQRVAGVVAGRIVDFLEAVQIDEQDRDARGPGNRVALAEQLAHPLGQPAPVVQPGQRIARRQIAQLLLSLAHGPDVVERQQHRFRLRRARLDDRHRVAAHPDDVAVREPEARRIVELRGARDERAPAWPVVRRDRRAVLVHLVENHRRQPAPDQIALHAHHPVRARIARGHHAVARHDQDAFVQAVDHQPMMFLAAHQLPSDRILVHREADAIADIAQQVGFGVGRTPRLVMVDGERAEHGARVVEKRHRPARAQAERQRERTIVGPERIGFDVLDGDHPAFVHRRAARTDGRPDRQAFDRGAVLFRQRRRRADVHVDAIRIEQQDRAGRPVAEQRLGTPAYLKEQLGQRRVARDQPQHTLLGREYFRCEPGAVARTLRFDIQYECCRQFDRAIAPDSLVLCAPFIAPRRQARGASPRARPERARHYI
jgi:AraC-like DNA-binding protein